MPAQAGRGPGMQQSIRSPHPLQFRGVLSHRGACLVLGPLHITYSPTFDNQQPPSLANPPAARRRCGPGHPRPRLPQKRCWSRHRSDAAASETGAIQCRTAERTGWSPVEGRSRGRGDGRNLFETSWCSSGGGEYDNEGGRRPGPLPSYRVCCIHLIVQYGGTGAERGDGPVGTRHRRSWEREGMTHPM